LCPFHSEKNPSFAVNQERQVWFCHACAFGGDIIELVRRAEHLSFGESLRFLGMADGPHRGGENPHIQKTKWINSQREKLNARLRELDEQLELADELGDLKVAQSIWNERRILADLRDDFGLPQYFFELKDLIQNITRGFE